MVLISPKRINHYLNNTVSPSTLKGPHTALLIIPQGQLLAVSSVPLEPEDEGEFDDPGDEEPWLEGPERLGLLLGLASQWEEDASPRVACELGRLLLHPIILPPPESAPPNAALPSVRPPVVKSFILVLNGTTRTPWNVLSAKADEFVRQVRLSG